MDLYHCEVGFPRWFKAPTNTIRPRYGNHARFEAKVDLYGHIDLPKTLDLSKMKVIEIGVEDGRVAKILFRGPLDSTRDLCIVIQSDGVVRTVWVNLKTDKHRTLDRTKYCIP